MKNTPIANLSNDQLGVVYGGSAEEAGGWVGAAAGCAAGIRYVPGNWAMKAGACIVGATGLADWGATAGNLVDQVHQQPATSTEPKPK